MNLYIQLILDFVDEVIRKPTVLVGNSVGSLACVIAASGMLNPTNFSAKEKKTLSVFVCKMMTLC